MIVRAKRCFKLSISNNSYPLETLRRILTKVTRQILRYRTTVHNWFKGRPIYRSIQQQLLTKIVINNQLMQLVICLQIMHLGSIKVTNKLYKRILICSRQRYLVNQLLLELQVSNFQLLISLKVTLIQRNNRYLKLASQNTALSTRVNNSHP